MEQNEPRQTGKGLYPLGGFLCYKIHFTLKYVQVVKKESDLVPEAILLSLQLHTEITLGNFKNAEVLASTQTN